MNTGYFDNGKHYCSDRCFIWGNSEASLYDMNDWERDCEGFTDECYYTEWEELDENEYYDADGNHYLYEDGEFKLER